MTKVEATNKLVNYCDDQVKKSRFLGFNKREISVEPTILLEQWQRTANLTLPSRLCFPKGKDDFVIDFNGIKMGKTYKWSDIAATAIKTETIILTEDLNRHEYYLLTCLNNGDILERDLGNIAEYHGQLGHFIEQYKIASV